MTTCLSSFQFYKKQDEKETVKEGGKKKQHNEINPDSVIPNHVYRELTPMLNSWWLLPRPRLLNVETNEPRQVGFEIY